jgi:hypothetical protein
MLVFVCVGLIEIEALREMRKTVDLPTISRGKLRPTTQIYLQMSSCTFSCISKLLVPQTSEQILILMHE